MFAKYLRIPQNHILMLLIALVLARFHFTQQIFWVLRSVRNLNFVIDRRLQDSDKSSWQIFELLWLLIKTISAVISNGEFLTIAVTMRHRIKNMVCYRWSCPTKKWRINSLKIVWKKLKTNSKIAKKNSILIKDFIVHLLGFKRILL